MRLLLAAVALSIVGLSVSPSGAQAHPTSMRGAAERALSYLANKQLPDGSLLDIASVTEDFIFGTTATGRNPNSLVASSGKSVYEPDAFTTSEVPAGLLEAPFPILGRVS